MTLQIIYSNPGLPVTYTLNSDPTSFTGWNETNAEQGSLLIRTDTSALYYKSGVLQTDWTIFAGGIPALAAIAFSGSATDLVAGTVPAARMPALSGDVALTTGTTNTTVIGANKVTDAMLAQAPANTIVGNNAGGVADKTDLTVLQVRTMLGIPVLAAIATSGSADDLIAGTVPAATMPALSGDVTLTAGTVNTMAIGTNKVTDVMLAQAPANTLVGNDTGGVANKADLTVGQVQTMLGFGAFAAIATSGSATDLVAGTVPAATMPALSGDVTLTAGTVNTMAIGTNKVTDTMLAQAPANTLVGNNTGGVANKADLTIAQVQTMLGVGGTTAGSGEFGSGFDGVANFDGVSAVTGWTRVGTTYFPTTRPSWYFTTATIAGGVILQMEVGGEGSGGGCSAEFHANVAIVIPSGTAIIKINGATPTGSAQVTNMTTGHFGTVVGQGAGGIQNAGQNAANHAGAWFNSFKAGAGGFGGASLTNAGSTTAAVANSILADSVGLPLTWHQLKLGRLGLNNPGLMAGGGGGGSGGGTTGVAAGGAGGNGAGFLAVSARNISGNLTLQAIGGNGAPGVAGVGSNAGGGSGGGGGVIACGVGTSTTPAGLTLDVSGGTGGAPQLLGSAGGNGSAGQKVIFLIGPS